jgi:outer membrane protein OmpA-like peptidoglycan-associated protein
MKSFGLASLSLLGAVFLSGSAFAQEPPQPDQPLPPPPGGAPADPYAQPGGPPPGPYGQPGVQPEMQPAGPPPAGASAGAGWSTSGGFDASADVAAPTMNEDEEREWRRYSLHNQNNLSASTGLLHLSAAGSGAPGTLRISLISSYFSGKDFLCDGSSRSCPDPQGRRDADGDPQFFGDDVTRLGAHLGINATLVSFLEGYMGLHAYATENDQGRPQLLQVLGDMNLGLKAFIPHNPDQIFSVGGELQLWLLNGTGGVGLNGDGTSFTIRGLATADLNNRSNPDDRVPLRAHLNLGYHFDNSGNLVEDTESRRGEAIHGPGQRQPISRIERFGLDINKVDSFKAGIGLEGMFPYIRPFAEWTIDVPVNRQDYICNISRVNPADDQCLGNASGFSTSPSRLTLGARGYPPLDGLSLLLAFDIGTGATSDFIEEVAPEPPWQLYLGAAFAFDTQPPTPVIKQVEVERIVDSPVQLDRYVVGTVVEKGTSNPVPNAIVRFDGRNLTGMVSGEDGSFRTINLDPGTYTFNITAPGYREGQCTTTMPAGPVAGQPAPGGPPGPYYQPGPQPGAASGPYYGQPTAAPSGPTIVNVTCELEALPKVGNVVGGVVDAESNAPVPGARVKITDKLNRELELNADQSGAFRFENVPPGTTKITVDAPGFFANVTEFEVVPREDFKATVSLNRRPATPNVVVAANEIKLRKQVHFAHDSSEIQPDSQALLDEIADVFKTRDEIRRVEIQGHTDNTGTPAYNQRLSQQRAEAVREALVRLGVDSSRLEARGYGQDKPLVPNVSPANRAKNRRVQIIIKEKGR